MITKSGVPLLLACLLFSTNAVASITRQSDWSFDVGESWVSDANTEDVTGLKTPDDWESMADFATPPMTYSAESLPARFDWRTRIDGLPPIKNQGKCGSCWAFGTVGVIESLVRIKTGRTVTLSEQELVSCSQYGSCNGGWFAHGYHTSVGAAPDEAFPYTAKNSSCSNNLVHNQKLVHWSYIGQQGRAPTTNELKAAIYQYGPIAVTVTADRNMQAYKGGIFNACSKGRPNHIVNLIGWDDAQDVWILRNSWGEKWGEKGYMRIKYGCSRVGQTATYAEYDF